MTSPLSNTINIMQAISPVFRRACHEPPGEPVDLPTKLTHPVVGIRHFAAFDIMISVSTSRPMFFRYNVSWDPTLCESLTDDFGIQWLNGIPDAFILILARMNMLRDDYAPNVAPEIINELEQQVKDFQAIPGVSSDPTLTVARLVVQECWRQAVFIYIYMVLSLLSARLYKRSYDDVGIMWRRCDRSSG